MALDRTILVVSPTPSIAQALAFSARRSGYQPVIVGGFVEAKKHLATVPHLVVTELKLGEYNGLHLALRAMGLSIPTIVVADAAFESEVENLGSTWVSPDAVKSDKFPAVMLELAMGGLPRDTTIAWQDADSASAHPDVRAWETGHSPLLH